MQKLLEKLYLDKHHKIEHFGVVFLALSLCLAILVASIGFKHFNDNHQTLTAKCVYTNKFKTSLTGASGSVQDVYVNSAHTKAFILVKFDDVSNISTDASSYQAFLTGSSLNKTATKLNINPSGSIYMFGSTGYMGIYLSESRGFDKQILDVVVRANTQLAKADTSANQNVNSDASFKKYDQFHIYFNAGGADATVAPILDTSDNIKVSDMYDAFISSSKEKTVRDKLDADLSTMKLDLAKIQEYKQRLATAKVQIPDDPEIIRGDACQTDSNGKLTLVTNSIVPTGFDFDWRDGSVKQGYLKDLANGTDVKSYLNAKSVDSIKTPSGDSKTCYTPFSINGLKWIKADGSTIDSSGNKNMTSSDTSILNSINGLQSAWQTYYADKTAYQTVDLKSLLAIELDVLDSNSNFTLNNSANVLTNWQSK